MPDNWFDLTGKVAVVTGGSGVLGSAMCRGQPDHAVFAVE
jgi:FlaA1/EpsC-like NDP-sugar epimerase